MHDSQRNAPLSVSDFTRRVKTILESDIAQALVVGEISHLNVHQSGHVYLTLKDEVSRLEGVVWRSTASRLKYRPGIGEKVIVRGRINVHVPHGSYKLVIDSLEPAGIGHLQAAFETLKSKLQQEGLFDRERKRLLPLLPRRLGVITSPTGAARRDVESVVFRRCPQVEIILYPAIVQGERSARDLVRGIEILNNYPGIDLIILGRGGGSIEDLWSFNDESVARAIAGSRIPVISAVGHETDTTISDLVADVRAPTPSAAAEVAVPVRDDLLYSIDLLLSRLTRSVEHRVSQERSRLETLRLRLENQVDVSGYRQSIDKLSARIERSMDTTLRQRCRTLQELETRIRHHEPRARVARSREALKLLEMRLLQSGTKCVETSRFKLTTLAARLSALSPLGVLERGYCLTKKDNNVVRGIDELTPGDRISILMHNGRIDAQVHGTSHNINELGTKEAT